MGACEKWLGKLENAIKILQCQRETCKENNVFPLSGPTHLSFIDWKNAHYRRSVAACLVQGVYVLERDRLRQLNHQGSVALAPPWWEFFHFHLLHQLDDVDSSIFGALYIFKPPPSIDKQLTEGAPLYVIAFRGTIIQVDSFAQDVKLDLDIIRNGLQRTPRFEIAMQAVRDISAKCRDLNIWLTGHSLGAAMAMLAGKNMAKTGIFLEAFIFNPPFISAPIESIKDENVKHGIRIASSFFKAGLVTMKGNNQRQQTEDPFAALSAWVPCLFVNPGDIICSEHIGYFAHRQKMDEIGAGEIERLATQHSIRNLLMGAMGRPSDCDPFHLLPSANVTVNHTPSPNFIKAHAIQQWWRPDLHLQSNLYHYGY